MIREYPNILQGDDYSCGDAVVDGALRFLGLHATASVLRLATPLEGIHPATIQAMFYKAGARVNVGTFDLDTLKYHTKRDRPVICPINLFGGHWVTVLRVTAKKVHYHCPVASFQSTTHDSWNENWHDESMEGHVFDNWGIAVWKSQ